MRALVLLAVLALASPSWAATRWVDNDSTGCSNPDTDYTPATRTCGSGSATVYSTIGAGVTAMAAQDVLNIRGVTTSPAKGAVYTESTAIFVGGKSGASYAAATIIRGCGTFTTHALVPAQYSNPDCPADARPVHRPSSNPGNNVWNIGNGTAQAFTIIEGLEIDALNTTFTVSSLGAIFIGSSASNIKISNNKVYRAQFTNVYCSGAASSVWITSNYIAEGGRLVREGDQEHNVYCPDVGNLYEYNEILNASSAGITSFSASTNNSIIRFNYIHDNGVVEASGSGIELLNCSSGCFIYGNILSNNKNGIGVAGSSSNVAVYNNTVYGHDIGGGTGIILSPGGSGHTLRNNISVENDVDLADGATGTTKNNNLCDSGCDEAGGAPVFENALGNDFRLAVGSNGIDDGATIAVGLNTQDILGVSRPQGSAYDLGAYEYSALVSDPNRPRLR